MKIKLPVDLSDRSDVKFIALSAVKGGLERDVEELCAGGKEAPWIRVGSSGANRISLILRYIAAIRRVSDSSHLIITAGGGLELVGAIAGCLFRGGGTIFSPGAKTLYLRLAQALLRLDLKRSIQLFTCSQIARLELGEAVFYDNYAQIFNAATRGQATSPDKIYDWCHVGRNDNNKGFDRFLNEAASYTGFSKAGCRLRVLHLGEGTLKSRGFLEVDSFGHLPSQAVRELIQASKVLVISSDYEGSPRVVAEALSEGVPIATTRCGNSKLIEELEPSANLGVLCARVHEMLQYSPRERDRIAARQASAVTEAYRRWSE